MQVLFDGLQQKLAASLQMDKTLAHPVAKGDATEADWKSLLELQLPARYQVDRGFVIDARGKESQFIDLIVFDRQYCPVLFKHSGQSYIPAEAVYSVFEIRPNLSKENVAYAGEKASSVRVLQRTSAPIVHAGGRHRPRKPFEIPAGLLTLDSDWTPPLGASFEKALFTRDKSRRLNLGCCLNHGAFVATYRRTRAEARFSKRETALVSFFLSLIEALQTRGTVPAMDLSVWGKDL